MNTRTPLPPVARASGAAATLALLLGLPGAGWAQSGSVYYVCPGNVFTNTISAKEAETRGCKTREATSPSVVSVPRPRLPSGGGAASGSSAAAEESRVRREDQRARDTDARRILEEELRKEEAALDALRKEYNNGEPERRGDERNAQKYLDRVAELKAAVARKEADVAAIRRELAKLSQ